ncbi:unnamed protein product [Orchesella dallaii]|uniref:Protein I'm not dead yet n=1 Tax=Orchesella dallaii TaxID=48710 RepID=A0ABP1S5V6_9HEXA
MVSNLLRRKLSWTVWSDPGNDTVLSKFSTLLLFLKTNWTLFVAVFTPFILILVPASWEGHNGKEPYAAYIILLMSIYWMTECIPLPVTALLPILFFPLFAIAPTEKITSAYLQDSIFFLFGGCIIALSFEYSNLHTRIALKVIMVVGAKISQLMLGLMITTMFLSMWMNNTSTTAMMVPIVGAIMDELRTKMLDSSNTDAKAGGGNGSELEKPEKKTKNSKIDKKIRDLKIMFLLATAYSSNIGGTGVITGSGTNVIVLDLVRKDADEPLASEACRQKLQISFLDWMMFNTAPMLVNTLMCWIYLQVHFLGLPKFLQFWKTESKEEKDEADRMSKALEKSVKKAMKQQYDALGPIRFNEIGVLVLFIFMVILWIFKDPQFIPGWDALPIFDRTPTGKSFIKECTPTLLVCVLMFIIPGKAEYYRNFRTGGLGEGMKDPLLSFDFILKKFPWGIFILLGGGSAMALGAKESGLNKSIEEFLENNETLQSLSASMILLTVLFMIAALTSVSSSKFYMQKSYPYMYYVHHVLFFHYITDTATAAIVVPVLLGMAYVKNIHPLYLVYPASTVCSYAFVLPVSTPPNAIVYSSTDLKLGEMMRPGFLVNVFSIGILFISTHTVGWWIFDFGGYKGECSDMAHFEATPVVH